MRFAYLTPYGTKSPAQFANGYLVVPVMPESVVISGGAQIDQKTLISGRAVAVRNGTTPRTLSIEAFFPRDLASSLLIPQKAGWMRAPDAYIQEFQNMLVGQSAAVISFTDISDAGAETPAWFMPVTLRSFSYVDSAGAVDVVHYSASFSEHYEVPFVVPEYSANSGAFLEGNFNLIKRTNLLNSLTNPDPPPDPTPDPPPPAPVADPGPTIPAMPIIDVPTTGRTDWPARDGIVVTYPLNNVKYATVLDVLHFVWPYLTIPQLQALTKTVCEFNGIDFRLRRKGFRGQIPEFYIPRWLHRQTVTQNNLNKIVAGNG